MDRHSELRDRLSHLGLQVVAEHNDQLPSQEATHPDTSAIPEIDLPAFPAGVFYLDEHSNALQAWGSFSDLSKLMADESFKKQLWLDLANKTSHSGQWDVYDYQATRAKLQNSSGCLIFLTERPEPKVEIYQQNKHWRTANCLRRVGRVIHEHNRITSLSEGFANEVVYAAELAACMVWILQADTETLTLQGHAGVNRMGRSTMEMLSAIGGPSCAAEMVAQTWKPLHIPNVHGNVLTENLEARFCYREPEGALALPLFCDDNLVGVVEYLGQKDSETWEEDVELFEILADHFSLAINSATLFERFEQLASHDGLTGLANHRTINEFVHRRVAEGDRTGQGLGLMMIDVDHFRSFNEEEGHDAGDEVLKMVADALRACLRPYDIAARYGGEEFTVAMPGSTLEGLLAGAERMRERVEAIEYLTRSGRKRSISVSVGCSLYPITTGDATELFKAADTALYRAKRGGRNRVEFYEGRYLEEDSSRAHIFDLTDWLTDSELEEAHRRVGRVEPELRKLCINLRLSPPQQRILHTLLLVIPTFPSKLESGKIDHVLETEAYRLLGPSLEALGERFDGKGPRGLAGAKIPLLARAAEVLLCLDGAADLLVSDSRRFDPEIIGILSDAHAA